MNRYIIILILSIFSCKRKNDNISLTNRQINGIEKDTLKKQIYLNDTIFIHREFTKEFYHKIFIDTNRESEFYKKLTDFKLDEYDINSIIDNYEYFKKKSPSSFKIIKSPELHNDWLPVYKYKERYYLYYPSDWGSVGKRIINDSLIIYWQMDGPLPLPLKEIKRKNSYQHNIKITNLFYEEPEIDELSIIKLDKKTNLSLFIESSGIVGKPRYQLYIPKENAKYFDLIVNYCKNYKQVEFDFDEIDFKKLIQNNR